MSFADQLLIGWWVASPVVSIALLALFRLHLRPEQGDVTLALTRGVSPRELRYRTGGGGGPIVVFLLILFGIAALVLLISFFVLFAMHGETRLYVLNFQISLVLFGALLLFAGFAKSFPRHAFWPKPNSLGDRALRFFTSALAPILIVIGMVMAIGDVFYPSQIIEGKVESLRSSKSSRGFFQSYWVVIDGRRYETTNEVFSALSFGDPVRAEMGIGSKTIFRAQPTPVTTR